MACGTGRHLELLGPRFERVGTDYSASMLAVARRRLPDVEFVEADMAELALGRQFDVVTCLFSSIGAVRTLERMQQTVARLTDHVAPGGALLVEPWFTPAQYWDGHVAVNHATSATMDVTWMYVQRRDGDLSRALIHYLVARRGEETSVEHFTEEFIGGLFTDEQYVDAFRRAGLEPVHEPAGLFGRGLYWALKPGEPT